MGRSNVMKSTSVNLYEDDLIILQKRGISVSDTIRELIHHICQNDTPDVLKAVRIGQTYEQINILNDRIETLIEKRDSINDQIGYYQSLVQEIAGHQTTILEHQSRQDKINRICEIGKAIDILMYKCNFDAEAMRKENIPELKEMEELNPGWSLEDHIKMRRAVGDGSCVSFTR